MPYLLVRYKVRNYDRWRAVFDADTVKQRKAFAFVRHVLHDENNDKDISLVVQTKDKKGVYRLSQRKDLDKLIKQAGLLRETVRYRWVEEK